MRFFDIPRTARETTMRAMILALLAPATALGCDTPEGPLAEREAPDRETATVDVAVIAALDYVADLERRATAYQGERAFRLSESVSVVFGTTHPPVSDGTRPPPGIRTDSGPRWSSAVEDTVWARGWRVTTTAEAMACGDQQDFYGNQICWLRGDVDGLLLEVGRLAYVPYPAWPEIPEPPGTGGVKVNIGSFRNRVVPFDRDRYQKVYEEMRAGFRTPWDLMTTGERAAAEKEIMAAYDQRAGATGDPGVLFGVSYFVRVAPGGNITHSVVAKPLLVLNH